MSPHAASFTTADASEPVVLVFLGGGADRASTGATDAGVRFGGACAINAVIASLEAQLQSRGSKDLPAYRSTQCSKELDRIPSLVRNQGPSSKDRRKGKEQKKGSKNNQQQTKTKQNGRRYEQTRSGDDG